MIQINYTYKTVERTDTMYYVHQDRLGNYDVLTNDTGVVIVHPTKGVVGRLAYDVWGNRVLWNDWTQRMGYDTEDTTHIFRRGFTQHEHLGAHGIINMNGRMYDPNTASFFSPDPFVQAPFNTQSFNRYSYCLNNPLMYVDPTGEIWGLVKAVLQSAVRVTIVNAVKDLFKNIGNTVGDIVNDRTINWKWNSTVNSAKITGGWFIGKPTQILSRWTFEFPQTILGNAYTQGRNLFGNVDRVDYFGGATFATKENAGYNDGLALGSFININNEGQIDGKFSDYIVTNYLYMHEYGHYRQSQAFGPLYLPRFGLPSLLSTKTFSGRYDAHLHPVEQDANARAYNYFKNKEGFRGWNNPSYPKELGYLRFGWNDAIVSVLTIGTVFNPFALPFVFAGSGSLYTIFYRHQW